MIPQNGIAEKEDHKMPEDFGEEDYATEAEEEDSWDDYCDECRGYGDDYSIDESGEFVCNCFTCPFGGYDED